MVAFNFNPSQHNPRFGGGDTLGVGKHPVVGSAVALKDAKSGQGGYLELTVTAIDGPEKGGRKALRFNLHHTNQDTQRIAHDQLAATCIVMGVTGPWADTDILLNKPFVVEIAPQKGNDQYTEVVAVYTMDGRDAGAAAKDPPKAAGASSGPSGFGGGNAGGGSGFAAGAGASAGGWGGGQQTEEKPKEEQQGGATGWGGGAAGGASGGSGWQQSGGSSGPGWGSAA